MTNSKPVLARPPASASGEPRRVASQDLLGSARDLLIEHRGQYYRLHLTRSGKLILTK